MKVKTKQQEYFVIVNSWHHARHGTFAPAQRTHNTLEGAKQAIIDALPEADRRKVHLFSDLKPKTKTWSAMLGGLTGSVLCVIERRTRKVARS